jgi:hypothetical protein
MVRIADATASKRQLALGVAATRGSAVPIVLVAHRREHAHASVHHGIIQRRAGLEHRPSASWPICGVVPWLRSFFLVLASGPSMCLRSERA